MAVNEDRKDYLVSLAQSSLMPNKVSLS